MGHTTASNTVHGNLSNDMNMKRQKEQNTCTADGKKQKHILTKTQEKEGTTMPGLSGWIYVPSVPVLPQTHAHLPLVQCHSYHCKHSQKHHRK